MKKIIISILISALVLGFSAPAATTDLPNVDLTPDSPFYFVKTWKESIQTFFTFGAENKAKRYLHLAEVRLAEYQKMLEKGKTEIAERTLNKYEEQLNRALPKVQELKDKGKDVKDLSEKIEQSVSKHLEVLQENLQKVPEQAKKGIENAIENSNKNLEKILEIKGPSLKSEKEEKTGDNVCNDGTPVGKCNRETGSINFYKYCNESKQLVEDCTKCGCAETLAICNPVNKKCEINISKRCPPYEEGCNLNKEVFSSCEGTLKLKGNIRIGVIILSQFTEQQFPQSYLHLIKGQLSNNERNFFDKDEYLHGNIDYYKLNYINTWLKQQAKRILGNESYANIEFKFSTKEVCYLDYDDYHNGNQNQDGTEPQIFNPDSNNNNKLFNYITSNCMDGIDKSNIDAILVFGFVLDGAETLKSGTLGDWRGGVKTSISIGNKIIPLAWIDVTTLPPFCKEKVVPPYEKCQFPLGGSRKGTGCMELTCSREECCYNSQLTGCGSGCISPTGIRDINSLAAHELLHIFGVPDHSNAVLVEGYGSCADFDTSTIPINVRLSQLSQCEGRTICSVCYSTGNLPLECAVITNKEARELGWNDNNSNGILELDE